MTVHLIPITFDQQGTRQTIVPVLLKDEHRLILVDCGYPGFLPLLEDAARERGLSLDDLTHVIVTHHDMDHMGALAELKRAYPSVEIIAHELDEPHIAGRQKSLRLEQAESLHERLPEERKPQAESFIAFLRSIEPASVDRIVADGEVLPWCGGLEIVHTPGHMPGHISIYVQSAGIMLAADAVVIEEDGKLGIANPEFTMDRRAAAASIERLSRYAIHQLICYHGGLYEGDAGAGLRELLRNERGESE
ncbi:MBL fold metallo-hydrolase [Paenibacillus soyae]|uniref:MBL fold metallo-hydrolase n=1 Tax=Paenibacillus soyae TaxID=2969249 RepID=A0A9X2MQT6_9BACL|nr:MBL fold metallo-hydrolase [Paenibacillus soyae]MCR2806563.1 MBL fold metallo-hydrolase [Paenibacillus soyae]